MSKFPIFFRWFILTSIVAVSGSLMLSSAWQESAVMEEPVNLNKILAALPLLTQKLNFNTNPDLALFWIRLIPIFLALILISLVYLWSKEIIGRWWALLPALFLAFSPTFLAKGHYFASDIGLIFGLFIALTGFLKFLFNRTAKNLMLAGLAFGIAQIIDFSLIFFVPLFTALLMIFYFTRVLEDWPLTDPAERPKRFFFRGMRYLKYLFLIFLIGFMVIYIFYLLTNWDSATPEKAIINYFLELTSYLKNKKSLFFLNAIYDSSPASYLPTLFLLKEPLVGVLATLAALIIGFWKFLKELTAFIFKRSKKPLEYLSTHFPEFSMILTIVVYWIAGNQKILPILPFIYLLTSESIKNWFGLQSLKRTRNFIIKIVVLTNELAGISVKTVALAGLLMFFIGSALLTYPNFNSYFNIAASGANNGYQYLSSENYDWGQDLKRLAEWIKINLSPKEKIAVDYYSGGDIQYYLGEQAEPWLSAKGTPITDKINWLAISATNLQMARAKIMGSYQRKPEDEYPWLENFDEPHARAGTIFIYRLHPTSNL